MENKKGFTLVELIASICILVMLSTIVLNFSLNRVNKVKDDSYNLMIDSIELAAKQYVLDNEDNLTSFKENYYIYITLEELINNNYFTNNLVNTITDKSLPISDEVYVTKSYDGTIKSYYDDSQNNKTKLILNGSYNVYVRRNSIYYDEGIKDEYGSIVTEASVNMGDLDITKTGYYTITYKYNNSVLERNIIVIKEKDSITNENTLLLDHINSLFNDDSAKLINGLEVDNTTDQNIRYVGSSTNVKNYLSFNNELWRIVGIFNNKIKIVRDSTFSISSSWDSSSSSVNTGYGVNTWSSSDLYNILNGYYLSGGTCSYCNGEEQETCTNDCTGIIVPIDSDYISMIDSSTFNTGTVDMSLINDVYESEKLSTVTSSVGLLNVSDYLYASKCKEINSYNENICLGKNWLFSNENIWTINSDSGTNYSVYLIKNAGNIDINNASNENKIKPVVYLVNNIEVINGTGTIDNPYEIRIGE